MKRTTDLIHEVWASEALNTIVADKSFPKFQFSPGNFSTDNRYWRVFFPMKWLASFLHFGKNDRRVPGKYASLNNHALAVLFSRKYHALWKQQLVQLATQTQVHCLETTSYFRAQKCFVWTSHCVTQNIKNIYTQELRSNKIKFFTV